VLANELRTPPERVARVAAGLERRGLVTTAGDGDLVVSAHGREVYGRLVEAGRVEIQQVLETWPAVHDGEAAPALRSLAVSLVAEMPDDG